MTAQTDSQRVQATRRRKERGLIAVTIPSQGNLSIDIRKEDLEKVLALAVEEE